MVVSPAPSVSEEGEQEKENIRCRGYCRSVQQAHFCHVACGAEPSSVGCLFIWLLRCGVIDQDD